MKTIYKLLSLPGLLLGTGPVFAQTVPLDIAVGYREVNVSGNADEYRSQINERSGILLRNITFATADFDGRTSLVDHLRVDGSDLGAGPAGALRLEAGRSGLWSLRFSYRHADFFSALPDFANPLFPTVIPGQHTIDRGRNVYDAEIEIFPGGVITPLIGYTRNTYTGPGRTTYHVGEDEFRLASNLDDIDQEVRVGANFAAGPISGRVVQGWRQFRERESLTLAPGEKNGNSLSDPVLGVSQNLTNLNRENSVTTNTPSTTALVTGRIGPRVRLIGSYQRASAETDTNETEAVAGSLVSFEISRFFAGLNETASTRAEATFWRGSGRAELTVADGVDFSVGWSRRHRYLDGFALVSTLYLNTVTFAGADPKDLLKLLQAQNAMDRWDNHFETRLSARGIGPWSGHVSWAETREDVTVTPDLSEIVVPGGQGGDYGRRVSEWSAGIGYTRSGFTFGADWIGERANDPIVRTDFLDRDRYRLRLSWTHAPAHLRVSATGQQLDASNDRPGIGYDGRIREYGGEIEFTPSKTVRAHFSASKYQADSTILYRVPQDFTTAVSDHRERGTSIEGGLNLTFPIFTLDGTVGRFENRGSYPFTIDRARVTGEVPVTKGISIIAEWMRDKYNDAVQDTGSLGKYAANRYGLYLRWQPTF